MTSTRIRSKVLPLGLAGAVVALAIAGAGLSETATAKPSPDKTAQAAQTALAKGQVDKAIQLAEGLVAAAPREPAYRALLGHAYLKAGRFESAVTTFNDAMKLGDNTSRTALGLALSNVAAGKPRDAVAILDDWRDAIPASDLGLALALAGETSRGVAILSDALRAGDASAKVRQNLAYAYALDGRWRDARVMAAMDVPADQIDARLSSWAEKSKPEEARLRVAGLINAPVRADSGQPTALALADNPPAEQLAAEKSGAALASNLSAQGAASVAAPVVAANTELPPAQPAAPEVATALAQYAPVGAPPVAEAAPAPAQQSFAETFAPQPAPAAAPAPVVRAKLAYKTPVKAAAVKAAPARNYGFAAAPVANGSHAVQLGSFSSPQGARRAWGIFAARNPELRKFKMIVTPAKVRGRDFWRVAAAGFDGRSAQGMCGAVKARGGVCFAYSATRVMPGALSAGAPALARVTTKAKTPAVAVAKPAPKPAVKAPAGPGLARRH